MRQLFVVALWSTGAAAWSVTALPPICVRPASTRASSPRACAPSTTDPLAADDGDDDAEVDDAAAAVDQAERRRAYGFDLFRGPNKLLVPALALSLLPYALGPDQVPDFLRTFYGMPS